MSEATNNLIQGTPQGSNSFQAATVLAPLVTGLEAVDPFFAVIGMVTTLFGFFSPGTAKILDELSQIEQ